MEIVRHEPYSDEELEQVRDEITGPYVVLDSLMGYGAGIDVIKRLLATVDAMKSTIQTLEMEAAAAGAVVINNEGQIERLQADLDEALDALEIANTCDADHSTVICKQPVCLVLEKHGRL